MNILDGFLVELIILMDMTGPAHAEFLLQQDRLTLQVQTLPLEEVILSLSQEGAFQLTILDKQMTDKMTMTEHFDCVPIEEGLSRLSVHWNYGLTKQSGSLKLQEVFLLSKRMKPEDLPTPTLEQISAHDVLSRQSGLENSETLAAFAGESPDKEYPEYYVAEKFEEERFEGAHEAFT